MGPDELKSTILELLTQIQEKIKKYKEEELPTVSKLYDYNEFNSMLREKISKEYYINLKEKIDTIDFEKLSKKIDKIEYIVSNYIEKCKNDWGKYNENFKNHLQNKFNNLLSSINIYDSSNFGINLSDNLVNKYINFYNIILNINTSQEIMESFSYGEKNYVIFGKNGAGKTRLLKYIKDNYFNSNSFVASSDREIRFGKLNNINMDYPSNYPLSRIFNEMYGMVFIPMMF